MAYQKYLKKEKLKDFKNCGFKELNLTTRKVAIQTIESKIQDRYDKSKPGVFSLGVEFEYSNQMFGHINITCGRGNKPYELSHLGYGYHSNLRSYHNSIINNQPFNQIHLARKDENPQNLSRINGEFKFDSTIVNLVNEFYFFHENIYEEFSKLTIRNFEDSSFLKKGISQYWFRKDIRWFFDTFSGF